MTAATPSLCHADSTAAESTVNFSQAHFAFRQLETWLTSDEASQASEAQVEEQLEQRGRELLRRRLSAARDHLAFCAMNSKTGLGSLGAVGKCPSPSLTITVIFPPSSL